MKCECCYQVAKDIFICHLGMNEHEANKKITEMFAVTTHDKHHGSSLLKNKKKITFTNIK